MNLVSLLPIAMAAVVLYVGLWHWLVYSRGSGQREHLWFALLCLGSGLFDLGAAASYAAGGGTWGALGQRLQNLAICLSAPALLWFVREYTGLGDRRLLRVLTAYYALHAVGMLTLWNGWIFADGIRVTRVELPWGAAVVYRELQHGPLLRLADVVHALVVVLVMILAVRHVREAVAGERPRAWRLLAGLGIFLVGGLNDLAVTSGFYGFVYLTEYSYLALVLVMTWGLSSAVLDLARTRSELRTSLLRLQRIFETLDEVYFETDLRGRFLEISPSVRHWVGPGVEMRGASSLDFYARPEIRTQMLEALRRGGRVRDFELDVRLPDGRLLPCAANLNLVNDEAGGEPRIVGSLRDRTEHKRAQAERERIEERMRQAQKLESLGVLAGGIAHDFNNFLAGILGAAELALLDLGPDHRARRRLEMIRETALRATGLCRQMLSYSGRARFDLSPVDLSALVREMADLLAVSVSKNVVLRYELAADLPAVVADPTQIRQVMLNLVINASEAIGVAQGTIVVRARRYQGEAEDWPEHPRTGELPPGERVVLEVIDDGCGMDEATQERLFDPFFTTKFSGRGLGLAAVLGIVRGHRGAVLVESRPGAGSRFRVVLPAAPGDAAPTQTAPTDDEAWHGRGLVLLVDDEPSVREVGREVLEHLGFEVRLASGGREAGALFRATPGAFVLAVVDLTMPDASGADVVRELLSIRPDLPVLVASGYSEEEGLERLANLSVSGFLSKPFSIDTLRSRIRSLLR